MLLVLMYHQILDPANPGCAAAFKNHLLYLQNNYPIILPGDTIIKNSLNICLTFDDAYFDFYHYVFPLLQQLKIPAVLGVPTGLIQDTTTVNTKDRLAIPYPYGLATDKQNKNPLCTWQEIQEMTASSYVQAASHSHNHLDLTNPNIDITIELQQSKFMLENKLATEINTLIYPFGKTSRQVNKLARQYYKHMIRIGSALNMDWQARDGLIYRVNADLLWQKNLYITNSFLIKTQFKYWLNYSRRK